jgi:hypothetical protein
MKATAKPVRLAIVRLQPGAYLLAKRWEVNRTREGALHAHAVAWYWRDRESSARSGLFATKAAAVQDAIAAARVTLERLTG